MDRNELANELRPYAAKTVGSIRIDVRELPVIVAALDEAALREQPSEADKEAKRVYDHLVRIGIITEQPSEASKQALVDQAQELGMGYEASPASDAVERVAKAIWLADRDSEGVPYWPETYEPMARAALAALEDKTDGR